MPDATPVAARHYPPDRHWRARARAAGCSRAARTPHHCGVVALSIGEASPARDDDCHVVKADRGGLREAVALSSPAVCAPRVHGHFVAFSNLALSS
jgi:hypothetical protein